jgi:hypothetical protein
MSVALLDKITADGGFTYDPGTDSFVSVGEATGYVIAIPGTEMLLGSAGMTRDQFAARFAALVSDAVTGHGVYVGGWLSPDRGYLIELSEVHNVDRATAIAIGVARNQEAIMDLATGEFIDTGGTGG